jgi:FMN phosphatase YigB (HAD superfamily)
VPRLAPTPTPRPTPRPANPSIVVFDIGGVLIDWNPRYLYRKLFSEDTTAMEEFLEAVCTMDWNLQQDAGRPWKGRWTNSPSAIRKRPG